MERVNNKGGVIGEDRVPERAIEYEAWEMGKRKYQEGHNNRSKTSRELKIKEGEGKGKNPNLISYPRDKDDNQAVERDDEKGETTTSDEESEMKETDTGEDKKVEEEDS